MHPQAIPFEAIEQFAIIGAFGRDAAPCEVLSVDEQEGKILAWLVIHAPACRISGPLGLGFKIAP